jgi:flagellar protein FliS
MTATTNAYRAQSLQNATGPQLVEACFREARKQLSEARRHLEAGTTASSYGPLERVRKIYTHLYSTLDLNAGGELATHMQALYVYVIQATLEVASTYDTSSLGTLEKINSDLLTAWSQIARREAPQATVLSGPFQARG